MRIAFSSDEETSLTTAVLSHLLSAGHVVEVLSSGSPWPVVGRSVEAFLEGRPDPEEMGLLEGLE